MNVGSLFSGIGGFDLGFERAGMRTVWQVEQSEFCRRVLARHFPGAERFEDVRDVGVHNLQPVDLVCGGFPCQDISLAGLGAGIDGDRSGLWAEFARVVRELRPAYVCVENVPALLGRGLGRVLGDLSACGYDAEWDCLPASAVGAPHRRDRFWLVAYPASVQRTSVLGHEPHGDYAGAGDAAHSPGGMVGERRRTSAGSDEAERPVGDPEGVDRGTGARQPARPVPSHSGWWAAEPDVGRVAHGVPARVDRLRSLGNALVPQIAEWIGRRILEHEEGRVAA